MDSAASRAFVSATGCFLRVADEAMGHLDEVGLGVWSVRDLLGHTSRSLSTVVDYLDAAQGRDLDVEVYDAAGYYATTKSALADADAVAQRGRAAGAALGDDPMAVLSDLAAVALERVAGARADAVVASPFAVMMLEDYLPTRVVELAVHTSDLAAAIGAQAHLPPEVAHAAFAVLGEIAASQFSAEAALLALSGRRALPDGYSLM